MKVEELIKHYEDEHEQLINTSNNLEEQDWLRKEGIHIATEMIIEFIYYLKKLSPKLDKEA